MHNSNKHRLRAIIGMIAPAVNKNACILSELKEGPPRPF